MQAEQVYQHQLTAALAELHAACTTATKVEAQVLGLTEEVRSLAKQQEEYEQEILAKNTERANSYARNANLKYQLKEAVKANVGLRERFDEAVSVNARLLESVQDATKLLDHLTEEGDHHRDRIVTLETQIKHLENFMREKSQGKMFDIIRHPH